MHKQEPEAGGMTCVAITKISARRVSSPLLFCAVAVLIGYSRASVPDYVLNDEVIALPERHRDQIALFTKEYFGTPLNPRWAAPAEDAAACPCCERAIVWLR